MTYGLSLFSGCLGLDLGLETAGYQAVGYVEKDPDCQRVIAARRPHTPIVEDVRDLAALKHFAGIDWLAGGFPCQDLSYAGKGAGLDGERSGLWFDMADAVRLLRPRLVLVENVSALATRGLGRVLYDLAEAGYVGSWGCVRAADIGAPHGRERIFVLAQLADADEPGPQGPESEGRRLLPAGRGGAATADADAERSERWAVQHPGPSGRRPEPAGSGAATTDAGGERLDGRGGHDSREAATEWAHGRPFASGSPEAATGWGEYEPAVRRWESVFGHAAPQPTDDRGRLSVRFVEWMLGFPAGWVDVGVSRSAQLRMLGNAVQVQVGAEVGLLLAGSGDIDEEAA